MKITLDQIKGWIDTARGWLRVFTKAGDALDDVTDEIQTLKKKENKEEEKG